MVRRKQMYYILAGVVLAVVLVSWKFTARSGYETAAYTVLKTENPFEVREYPDLMLAATTMPLESQGGDGSFMRLFQYISGKNADKRKVAMTTPVFMSREPDESQVQMGFVLPQEIVQQIPEPSSDQVQIQQRGGGRFAVIRFSGRMNRDSVATAEARLREWINGQGMTAAGEVESAGYDPPWTPGIFRRNEVLIRLQ